jgi:general stress protein YciG
MPNTPNRPNQQPDSQEARKRQQMNDKSLQGGGETGEDEDLPDADTQVNSNPGNFANDREKASDAGRKGGQR